MDKENKVQIQLNAAKRSLETIETAEIEKQFIRRQRYHESSPKALKKLALAKETAREIYKSHYLG